jgi:hypothetical protein
MKEGTPLVVHNVNVNNAYRHRIGIGKHTSSNAIDDDQEFQEQHDHSTGSITHSDGLII